MYTTGTIGVVSFCFDASKLVVCVKIVIPDLHVRCTPRARALHLVGVTVECTQLEQ